MKQLRPPEKRLRRIYLYARSCILKMLSFSLKTTKEEVEKATLHARKVMEEDAASRLATMNETRRVAVAEIEHKANNQETVGKLCQHIQMLDWISCFSSLIF